MNKAATFPLTVGALKLLLAEIPDDAFLATEGSMADYKMDRAYRDLVYTGRKPYKYYRELKDVAFVKGQKRTKTGAPIVAVLVIR